MREWDDVRAEAKRKGKKVHVGKVFEICVEKGSELPKGNPLRKFKGRTVFQGNNVQDENSSAALFSELGSSLWTGQTYFFKSNVSKHQIVAAVKRIRDKNSMM